MTKIAIVGGGFAGVEIAKSLQSVADVTLIEKNTHFVHTPAMVRATVQPEVLETALIPYENLLTTGKLIHAEAQSVDETGVTLADGTRVEADYIVVASGSANATPFKPAGGSIEALRADNAEVNAKLVAAKSVAIVGAGAVGTELAGEIAHFMPEKKVTLVSSDPTLFPDFKPTLGQDLQKKLTAAGVEIVSCVRAENLQSKTEPYAGSLTLSDGRQINADLIFPVIGSRAKSDLLANLPGLHRSTNGRVKVDGWMRPSGLPNVFAVGDVADNGDPMTVVAITRQGPWLAKLLKAVIGGASVESQKPFKPASQQFILLPLGPKIGSSFLGFMTVGNALTRMIKGKDLFLTKYNKLLGRQL